MINFQERYEQHSVHAEIAKLFEAVNTHRENLELGDASERLSYARFLRVIRLARRIVQNLDPMLVSLTGLNQAQKQFQSLTNQYNTFVSDKNWDTLANHTDSLLDQVYRIFGPQWSVNSQEVISTIHDFRDDAEKEIAAVKEATSESIASVREEQTQVSTFANSLKQLLDQHNQQFEEQKGRLDKLITDETSRFQDAEQQRSNEYELTKKQQQTTLDDAIADSGENVKSITSTAQTSFDALNENQQSTGDKITSDLQMKLEDAKRIVGLIGNTGMTGHYQKVANSNWWAAEILRVFALLFFVGLVAGVGWVVSGIGADNFSWEVAVFRVLVVATFLAPALYCARESGKHREEEHRNRRIELELASIEPYLDKLPEEKAQQIIEQLASQYFGNHSNTGIDSDDPASLKNIVLRGDQALSLVERLIKIAKP